MSDTDLFLQLAKKQAASSSSPNATSRQTAAASSPHDMPPVTSQPTQKTQKRESAEPAQQKLNRDEREQASMQADMRRTVKVPGSTTTYVRLTQAEKNRLIDLVYTYKRQGYRTSENEIVRIAINWLLWDYQQHGDASVLADLLDSLHR